MYTMCLRAYVALSISLFMETCFFKLPLTIDVSNQQRLLSGKGQLKIRLISIIMYVQPDIHLISTRTV